MVAPVNAGQNDYGPAVGGSRHPEDPAPASSPGSTDRARIDDQQEDLEGGGDKGVAQEHEADPAELFWRQVLGALNQLTRFLPLPSCRHSQTVTRSTIGDPGRVK